MRLFKRLVNTGFIAPGSSERDPGFQAEIVRLNRIGMRMAAALAILGPAFAILSTILLGNHVSIALVCPENTVTIFSPLIIFLLGILTLGLSMICHLQRRGRLLVAGIILLMFVAMMMETIATGRGTNVESHGTPITMLLLIAIGTMPYRGWHTFSLGVSLALVYVLSITLLPGMLIGQQVPLHPESFIFLIMLTAFCAAISTLIYNSRWRQYDARREEKSLRVQLGISEQKYRALFEESADGIFVYDYQSGRITLANPTLCEMLGLSVEELTAAPINEIVVPNPLQHVHRHSGQLSPGGAVSGQYIIRLRSRRVPEPLICDLAIHRSDQNGLFMGAVRDITDHVKMEAELAQLAQFPATNPFPILRCDYEGNIIYVNDSAREFVAGLGLPTAKIPALLPEDFHTRIRQLIDDDQTVIDQHHRVFDRVLSITYRPFPETKQIFIWLVDITKRIRSEEKVRAYAKELEAKNRQIRDTQTQLVQSEKMASLGNLVAGVAHEINTPLGSIHANADVSRRALEIVHQALKEHNLLPDPAMEKKLQRALTILGEANTTSLTASQRIVEIVRSLRSFARLDEAECKIVDLHEGIESTLTLVYHEFKNRIDIARDFGDLPGVECFPQQINQVFINILVNGIHAMPEKGTITITTRRVGENVTVAFTDTGVGIAPENLGKIFDPGFTTKGVGVGTGLGLSIVYKIVTAHRGTIKAQSVVGEGTTFTVTLPIKAPKSKNNKNGCR